MSATTLSSAAIATKPSSAQRIEYIDLCKFLGISLVIFGHMDLPNGVLQFIYAFHMPLFFILSGFTFKKADFNLKFISKRIKGIYIPYLLFALILCKNDFSSWAYIAYGSRNGLEIANTYTVLWFLPCFFAANMLFAALNAVKVKGRLEHIFNAVIILSLISLMWLLIESKADNEALRRYGYPFNFEMALAGCALMYFGRYMRFLFEWLLKMLRNVTPPLIVLFILTVGVSWFTVYANLPQSLNADCPHVEMSVGAIGNVGLFFFNAFILSFASISLSILISKINCRKRFLIFIGQNSLTLMCVHGVVLHNSQKVVQAIGLLGHSDMELMLKGIILFVMVVLISSPIIWLINRFVPNLAGKRS